MTIHAYTGKGEAIFGPIVEPLVAQASSLPTSDLCTFMNRFHSDKGKGRHNYTPLYDAVLNQMRWTATNVFELGVGTPSAMSRNAPGAEEYGAGASLRGWREYFPHAQIIGADIAEEAMFEDTRIATFRVNALSYQDTQRMWSEVNNRFPDVKFDLILDDGMHDFRANSVFLSQGWRKVKPGGFYIIEDIVLLPINVANFQGFLEGMEIDAVIVEIPHAWNHEDNCVAIMKKREA